MCVWSSATRERHQGSAIDEFREALEDFRDCFLERLQDLFLRQENHLDRLETILESQQETLLRFEDILHNIQHRLNSRVISSVGSVTDHDSQDSRVFSGSSVTDNDNFTTSI